MYKKKKTKKYFLGRAENNIFARLFFSVSPFFNTVLTAFERCFAQALVLCLLAASATCMFSIDCTSIVMID